MTNLLAKGYRIKWNRFELKLSWCHDGSFMPDPRPHEALVKNGIYLQQQRED